MKILMVLTSHADLGDTGHKTGFWLEEFAAPYYVFRDAGAEVTLASPAGGQPPIDPNSDTDEAATDDTRRFKADTQGQHALANTTPLAEIDPDSFDAVFYPGGHGPLYDLVDDRHSIALIETMFNAGKPTALVCHAPGALKNVQGTDGQPLVAGKRVAGFTDTEESAVGLADVVPFLVAQMLIEQGADYSQGADWQAHVVESGALITGQNPASSTRTALVLLRQLDV
ncbi:type 1 glutamine amidotransferase domain-containing protein [Salinisphaera sp. USBA-960]|uniref:type 1 glutamine amidotransferase domain-containing protein n=1 Tax=Salinisphaera orenii TaxID=856731 RepID=UPI000DBEA38E|nr:type 1 glutamine amidotransferase domain-containing protein [Salifodinibacter halophilus]NNC27171.1 type 1 glutamine amidotransferase domain-containing protein [Salifodinibacter halophilus]